MAIGSGNDRMYNSNTLDLDRNQRDLGINRLFEIQCFHSTDEAIESEKSYLNCLKFIGQFNFRAVSKIQVSLTLPPTPIGMLSALCFCFQLRR